MKAWKLFLVSLLAATAVLPLASVEQTTPPNVTFQDVAAKAGIQPLIVSGSKIKNYVLEVNGSGACWFDYNNDGYVDLYLVNG